MEKELELNHDYLIHRIWSRCEHLDHIKCVGVSKSSYQLKYVSEYVGWIPKKDFHETYRIHEDLGTEENFYKPNKN